MPNGFYDDKRKVSVPTQSQFDRLQRTVSDYYDVLNRDKAEIHSPTFTGTPEAPTAAAKTNTDQIATTKFVENFGQDLFTTLYERQTFDQAGSYMVTFDVPTGFMPVSVWVAEYTNLEFTSVTLLRISANRCQVMVNTTDRTTLGIRVLCLNNWYL